jgi:glycosyltransferase involved in cell wall biosynthesis
MKVLTLTNFYPGESLRGVFVEDEANGLRELGINVDLVAKTTLSPLGYIPFAAKAIHKVSFGNQDFVHAHFVPHSALIPAIIKRKPLVITFHGSDASTFPWKSRLHFLLTSFVVRRSDRIIAVSEDIRNTLVDKLKVNPRKIDVIHCSGVDTNLFKRIGRRRARIIANIHGAKPVVLFVGNLIEQKGIMHLLRAAQRMPRAFFYFIGRGHLKTNLRNCVILGEKNHEELPLWMSAADVLVLPSYAEGTPSVLLEALSCEIPVIATNIGGCPEVVRNGKTGFLIHPGDTDALVNRIGYLLTHRTRRLGMGRAGRKDMRQRYEHRRVIEKVSEIYADMREK